MFVIVCHRSWIICWNSIFIVFTLKLFLLVPIENMYLLLGSWYSCSLNNKCYISGSLCRIQNSKETKCVTASLSYVRPKVWQSIHRLIIIKTGSDYSIIDIVYWIFDYSWLACVPSEKIALIYPLFSSFYGRNRFWLAAESSTRVPS